MNAQIKRNELNIRNKKACSTTNNNNGKLLLRTLNRGKLNILKRTSKTQRKGKKKHASYHSVSPLTEISEIDLLQASDLVDVGKLNIRRDVI
eukprot:snap_masked-scaffold_69-processed-gene-0.4-mRNA-1 protein AED:1.00 eAED:1.00 QI:0/-1/0/0/-1/1/1/0/91